MKEKKVAKTILISAEQLASLKGLLEETGWEFSEMQYANFKAKQGDLSILAYLSGKLVLSGPESDVRNILDTIHSFDKSSIDTFTDHIGVDESGKGDFFGPLVIAGAFVKRDQVLDLKNLGVRDSKDISDKEILKIKAEIVKLLDTETIAISPSRYNEMYAKAKNINRILAWGHAKVIENLLERNPDCTLAVSDQFSKLDSRLTSALMEKGRRITFEQMHKGESDLAVAAASIIARAGFLEGLTRLGKNFDLELPKGASDKVIEVGKEFCLKNGNEKLGEIAKMNFSTAEKVIAK